MIERHLKDLRTQRDIYYFIKDLPQFQHLKSSEKKELAKKYRERAKVDANKRSARVLNKFAPTVRDQLRRRISERIGSEIQEKFCAHIFSTSRFSLYLQHGKPYANVSMTYGDQYSSRCRYKKRYYHVDLHISYPRYDKIPDDKKFLGGLITLSLSKPRNVGNAELYRATWLKKGKGYNLSIEQGYILCRDDVSFHFTKKTKLRSAIRSLETKYRNQHMVDLTSYISISQANSLITKIMSGEITLFDDVKISRSTSFKAGNCKPGTYQFIDVNDLQDQRYITIAEMRHMNHLGYRNEIKVALIQALRTKFLNKPTEFLKMIGDLPV